jgi:CRISPR-associated protein Cmx8
MAKANKTANNEDAAALAERSKSTAASKKTKRDAQGDGPIEVHWSLAALPTAQHRAGLAGLVMLVRWINAHTKTDEGVLELLRCDASSATLRVDRLGMRRLYSFAYAASAEEREESNKRKNKQGVMQEPKDVREREKVDPKTGKRARETVYVYEVTVPHGAFLLDEDPSCRGNDGLWIKLWRDFIWEIVRGIPKTRGPYERLASRDTVSDGNKDQDADKAYEALARGGDRSKALKSSYYLGAQEVTADAVPFNDREKAFFLLQFWPFAVSLYVPFIVDAKEGKGKFDGTFAVVVPDVSVLDEFCDEHFGSLRERAVTARGHRPEGAVVDVPEQAALAMAATLRDRLSRREGAKRTASLVSGYEVIHCCKKDKNVQVLRTMRMAPSVAMVDRYRTIETRFKNFFFRRQQIINLIENRPWWAGFDRLFAELPCERFVWRTGASRTDLSFGFDVRNAFKDVQSEEESMADEERTPESLSSVVRRVVQDYVWGRIKIRTGLSFAEVRDKPSSEEAKRFNEELERITRNAFLAIRSRTGADFVDYFVGTLCSVHQRVGRHGYETLSSALLDANRIDEVRTLTMLALSTMTGVFEKKAEQPESSQ